mmetsp:Transcript_6856/g.19246  ORF Transcript_6856/g.19246 Transcript_6856/m.19246 type:complete len:205 (+) Transcript_6856:318-932(+)
MAEEDLLGEGSWRLLDPGRQGLLQEGVHRRMHQAVGGRAHCDLLRLTPPGRERLREGQGGLVQHALGGDRRAGLGGERGPLAWRQRPRRLSQAGPHRTSRVRGHHARAARGRPGGGLRGHPGPPWFGHGLPLGGLEPPRRGRGRGGRRRGQGLQKRALGALGEAAAPADREGGPLLESPGPPWRQQRWPRWVAQHSARHNELRE